MTRPVPLSVPHLGGNEEKYLRTCVESNFVSSVGPFVERFEREFAAYVGAEHAVACSSGTAALHVALLVAGAAPGASVAVSTFTFIASVNAVAYTGATPLLVDSERRSWNLDAEQLYDYVVARADGGGALPTLIEVVHVLGHPAEMEPVLALRERYGIPIVEDAAEALGATYAEGPHAGRGVGVIGDLGCFSFNGNKIITAGGGGMIVTDDPDKAARARHLTTQARLPGREYQHDAIGFNYRLTNIAAAVGLAQLEQLEEFLKKKRDIASRYQDAFEDLPIEPHPSTPWANSSFWLYSLLLGTGTRSRDSVLNSLEREAIEARPLWPPVHRQAPYVRSERLGGRVSEDIYERGISLPSSVGLSEDEQSRVVDALRRAVTD